MSSPLYVFDLDETLIQGDCAMIWNAFLVDKGIATSADFIAEDRRLMALYAQGKMGHGRLPALLHRSPCKPDHQ